jgi:surfeit locus 1 family protein
VLLAVLALLGIAGLIALGVWQIERRAWKLALIDRVEQRLHAASEPMPASASWPAITTANDEYRRVTVAGRYLNDRETLVKAVTEDGAGFWVLTPLQTGEGTVVLINRGFVPPERRDPATRRDGDAEGMVSVTGLLRMTEPRGGFLRSNDPSDDRWYSRDVVAIASARGLSNVAPFFIDADATPNPGGFPQGGLTVVRFHNNHLIYALTWFCLAFMLAGALLHAIGVERAFRRAVWSGGFVWFTSGGARASARRTGSDAGEVVESA